MKKVFINDNNRATLTCPRCGKIREIDATPYLHSPKSAQIVYKFKCENCDCGHITCKDCIDSHCTNGNTNLFQLERRHFYRKEVQLLGTLFDKSAIKHPIKVYNLSRSGLKFSIHSTHSIFIGQCLTVEIVFDDVKESTITKEIEIKRIVDKNVTACFIDIESYDHNNKILGFYLLK
jgi:hypothetical protein